MYRVLGALTLSLAVAVPAAAASTTLKVDRRGRLVVPAAVVKQLGVTPNKDGLVELHFADVKPPEAPRPQGTKSEHRHAEQKPRPPQTWIYPQRDGSLLLPRTRASSHNLYLPGKPGTTYVVTGAKNRLVLRRPTSKSAAARGSGKPGRR